MSLIHLVFPNGCHGTAFEVARSAVDVIVLIRNLVAVVKEVKVEATSVIEPAAKITGINFEMITGPKAGGSLILAVFEDCKTHIAVLYRRSHVSVDVKACANHLVETWKDTEVGESGEFSDVSATR